jgi:hypothetical protein
MSAGDEEHERPAPSAHTSRPDQVPPDGARRGPGAVPGPGTVPRRTGTRSELEPDVVRARPVTLTCHWCDTPIEVKARGRLPRWCGAQCRHRAWEQDRAAASGRTAVRFVEQVVTVEREVEVEVETLPRGPGWAPALHALAHQVDTGLVYDRDLPALTDAYLAVGDALRRRRRRAASP